MSKLPSPLAIAGLLLTLTCLAGAPAGAASLITYVSGKGADTGNCKNPANPCRTIKYALSRTSPFGEIKALDPANYASATITRSVSITGVPGASINRLIVKTGATDVVNISQFMFDGRKNAPQGILFSSGGSLNINQSVFRNYTGDGILIQPKTGTVRFTISDVAATNNGGAGIQTWSDGTTVIQGVLDRVLLHANNDGLNTTRSSNDATARITVNESVASGNQRYGFLAGAQGALRLSHSVSTDNQYGIFVNTTAISAGNNFANGNTTDVTSGLATVPLR